MNYFGGLKVVLCEWLTDGTKQKRTHKKKRINKKWRRKYGHIGIPSKKSHVVGDTVMFHPETWEVIEKEINEGENVPMNKCTRCDGRGFLFDMMLNEIPCYVCNGNKEVEKKNEINNERKAK